MNVVVLKGRMTRDPELRTAGESDVCNFNIACQRNYKNANGEYDADFIDCVAWKGTAGFISKYFSKGSEISVSGRLQNKKYTDKNGETRYKTEVIVDTAEFCGTKSANSENRPSDDNYGFIPDDDPYTEEKLPWEI